MERHDIFKAAVLMAAAPLLTFLSRGEVIGRGTKADLAGEEIRHRMAGGAEMADLEKKIAAIAA